MGLKKVKILDVYYMTGGGGRVKEGGGSKDVGGRGEEKDRI